MPNEFCNRRLTLNSGTKRKDVLSIKIVSTVVSLALALALSAVDWEKLSALGYFVDRNVYFDILTIPFSRLQEIDLGSWYSYIFHEFLWQIIVGTAVSNGWELTFVFQFISVFFLFVTFLLMFQLKAASMIPFLVNPLIIDLAFSQYRLALALSILGSALIVGQRNKWAWVLVLVVPLIHTASLIFIFFYLFSRWILIFDQKRAFRILKPRALAALAGALMAVLIGPLREAVLTTVGDRRAEYSELGSSLLYVSLWIAILLVLCMQRKEVNNNPISLTTISILSLVAVGSVFGSYTTRLIAVAMPFTLVALKSVNPYWLRVVTTLCIFLYSLAQWVYWTGAL